MKLIMRKFTARYEFYGVVRFMKPVSIYLYIYLSTLSIYVSLYLGHAPGDREQPSHDQRPAQERRRRPGHQEE